MKEWKKKLDELSMPEWRKKIKELERAKREKQIRKDAEKMLAMLITNFMRSAAGRLASQLLGKLQDEIYISFCSSGSLRYVGTSFQVLKIKRAVNDYVWRNEKPEQVAARLVESHLNESGRLPTRKETVNIFNGLTSYIRSKLDNLCK